MIPARVRSHHAAVRTGLSLAGLVGAAALVAACTNDRDNPNGPTPTYDLSLTIAPAYTIEVGDTTAIATVTDATSSMPVGAVTFVTTPANTDVLGSTTGARVIGKAAGTSDVTVIAPIVNGGQPDTLSGTTTVTVIPAAAP